MGRCISTVERQKRASSQAHNQPPVARVHTGLTAFPAVESKGHPNSLQKGFLCHPEIIVVQIQKNPKSLLQDLPFVEAAGSHLPAAMPVSRATHATPQARAAPAEEESRRI